MISVLLPTRGRPALYQESLASLRNTALSQFEVCVGLDPDDVDTYEGLVDPNTCWIAPERYGYRNLHLYYNALAERSTGDWLFLWNDDAIMTTVGWDRLIEGLDSSVMVADMQSQHSPGLCCFPAVRRKAVNAVGGFSLYTNHCDTYWQDIGRASGTIQSVPAYIDHRRYDLSGQNNDSIWNEGQSNYTTQSYYSPMIQNLINKDTETIRGLNL